MNRPRLRTDQRVLHVVIIILIVIIIGKKYGKNKTTLWSQKSAAHLVSINGSRQM